jgi:hypothetical protein
MTARFVTLLLTCAALAACASTPDSQAQARPEKQYRTGSNIAVRDGEMPGSEVKYKPGVVPIGQGPLRSIPGSGSATSP